MGWKENIASPSFRGVPFEVESDELNGGRRTATHEYPLRDVPYTEDLGLKARGFSLSAFVVGADYFARRDKLVAALEDDGPGLLVHPQYGRIEVVVQTFRVSHSTDKGGMAQFQMAFVVAGKQVTPGRAMRTQDHVWDKSGTASSVAVSTLDSKFTLSGVPSFVTTSSHAAFVETVERIGEVRTALLDGAAFAKSLGALVGMTASTLSTISPGTELGGLLFDDGVTSLADLNLPATRMQEMLTLAATAPARVAAVIATPSRLIEASNTNALSDFLRQMAASEAARAAAAVTPETKADADRMTVQVTDAIDTVLETTADDAVFTAFSDLRTVTVRDLSERARQAKRLRTFTPTMTGPALVVAHRACDEGALAADDLVTRNAIRHPGFVGVEPLEVISA